MAKGKTHTPAVRFAAVFSQTPEALDWICERAASRWGSVLVRSDDLPFDQTRYYAESMGDRLLKRLVAFETLIDPTELVASKLQSNEWEAEYQSLSRDGAQRAVNCDPGYLTEAKVVLATMKDRDHRLYLGQGVFGEVTLYFQLPGKWMASRWTYPDFQSALYHEFFHRCRDVLRQKLQQRPAPGPENLRGA